MRKLHDLDSLRIGMAKNLVDVREEFAVKNNALNKVVQELAPGALSDEYLIVSGPSIDDFYLDFNFPMNSPGYSRARKINTHQIYRQVTKNLPEKEKRVSFMKLCRDVSFLEYSEKELSIKISIISDGIIFLKLIKYSSILLILSGIFSIFFLDAGDANPAIDFIGFIFIAISIILAFGFSFYLNSVYNKIDEFNNIIKLDILSMVPFSLYEVELGEVE